MMKKYVGRILILMICVQSISFLSLNAQDSVHVNLSKAIEIALSENPNIRIANRNIEAKKYYKTEQIASLFPSISLSSSYQRTVKKQKMSMQFGGNDMEIEVGTSNNYAAGINFSLPLVAAPTWFNLKLSELDVNLAIESARASKISLVNEIKKAYYTMLLAKDSYQVLLINYANVELNAKTVLDKYNQGMASEFDKLRSEVQVKNQKPQIISAKSTVELATMMLKVLIGVDINEPIIFDGQLADYESELQNYQTISANTLNLSGNSDLKQLDIAQKQLEMSQKLIKSAACPTLAFSGNYQYMTMANDFKFSNYNWFPYSTVGLSLQVPILSWVGTSYKIKQSKLSIANLQDQKQFLEKNLRVGISNSMMNIDNAIEELASNKETMMQAEEAYNIVQKQFEVGMATWLDLNSAELAMTQSRLLYHQSIYNFLTAKTELENILGNE